MPGIPGASFCLLNGTGLAPNESGIRRAMMAGISAFFQVTVSTPQRPTAGDGNPSNFENGWIAIGTPFCHRQCA